MNLEELKQHPANEIFRKYKRLDASIYIFNRNYFQLKKYIEFYKSEKECFNIIGDGTSENYWKYLMEVTRLLHNYVASVHSLIDHTRVYCNNEYLKKGLFLDYSNKVEMTFKNNSCAVFIKELRQYIQHYSIPDVFIKVVLRINNVDVRLKLNSKTLMAYTRWHKLSKEYIRIQEENVDLENAIDEYRNIVIEFYNWFRTRENDLNKVILQNYIELEEKKLQIEIPKLIEQALKMGNLDRFEEEIMRPFSREVKQMIKSKALENDERANCLIENFNEILTLKEDCKKSIKEYYSIYIK